MQPQRGPSEEHLARIIVFDYVVLKLRLWYTGRGPAQSSTNQPITSSEEVDSACGTV